MNPAVDRDEQREMWAEALGVGTDFEAVEKLGVRGRVTDINAGRFAWPYRYDPDAVLACRGHEIESVTSDVGTASRCLEL